MRADGARRLAAVLALVLGSIPATARGVAPAASDSARAGVAPDTTRARPVFSVVGARVPASARPAPAALAIDMVAERKLGAASLEDLLRFRRPVLVGALPLFGPTQGSLAIPDGGTIRLQGWANGSERATDEPLIGSVALGWGAPWLAFALSDPRADATEPLDLDALEFPSSPPAFRAPGEALARPVPRGPAFTWAPGDTGRSRASRTTLVYRRGSGDAQLTGVRFETNVFRRRLYASFSRNQAHAWAPLQESVSARYALRSGLGRLGSHRFELEGLLYERWIEDSAAVSPERGGVSEWDRRHVALSASREGERSSDGFRIRVGKGKETWVQSTDLNLSPEGGSRERWEFPAITAEGSMSWRPTPALTWIGTAEAASRKIVYRVDSLPAFEPRRGEARVHLGSRYALGATAGAGIDAAYDVRETQPGLLDARASIWGAAGRARGRLDMESAHERPSWVDLLTPSTLRLYQSNPASPIFALTELFRSGDPALEPRRLSGPIGSLALEAAKGLKLEFSGSYRRVTDDFGWNVSADTVAGTYRVSSVAGPRGSGWLSHGAIGWEFVRGAFRARGVGWIRGGPDSLSPQSGSPPRRALDAAFDLRLVLFHGDLPLRFGIESHARGPRKGLIREAGVITWNGSLSADFGSAGAFVRVQDAFDRRPGSAMWDPFTPSGAPMPGRVFQTGVVWNLLD